MDDNNNDKKSGTVYIGCGTTIVLLIYLGGSLLYELIAKLF